MFTHIVDMMPMLPNCCARSAASVPDLTMAKCCRWPLYFCSIVGEGYAQENQRAVIALAFIGYHSSANR